MKALNTLLKFTLVAAVIVTSTFACENISNPEPITAIDSTRTATIQGTAYANLDETNDTTAFLEENYERAPEGTSIKVVIDTEDLVANPTPGVNYAKRTYTTTVDASGNFSLEVEAADDDIVAELFASSFTAPQFQSPDSVNVNRTYTPQSFPYNVTIVAGVAAQNDVIYNNN